MATANQIAYAALKESERHNETVEQETERSNKAQEDLKRWQLDIDDRYKQNEIAYKNEQNRLTSEYNSLWAEAQKASLEEKQWYDQQMAYNMEQQRHNEKIKIENDYMVRQDEIALGWAQKSETTRHNEEMEKIQSTSNALKNKQLEYEKYQFDLNYLINAQDLEVRKKRLELDEFYNRMNYLVQEQNLVQGRRSLELKESELRLKEEMLPYEQKESKSRTTLNRVKSVTESTKPVTELVDSAMPF